MKKNLFYLLASLILIIFGGFSLQAQTYHYVKSKVFINTHGFIYISTGDTVILQGNIITVRDTIEAKRGMISFNGTADWKHNGTAFVDGYVRSRKPGAFIYPVGQGGYHPAAVSNKGTTDPIDVAYYNTPLYNDSDLGAGLIGVSEESWIIQGATNVRITLSWSTNIASVTDTGQLCVAGWSISAGEWVIIPSSVEPTSSIYGMASTTSQGSVVTNLAFAPNDYAAYTLGIRQDRTIPVSLTVFLEGPTPFLGNAVMTNYIQNADPFYSAFSSGPALPTTDPYGLNTTCTNINNIGIIGEVVDWIKVEIWDNVDFELGIKTVLETQALLLRPDGTVVDSTGRTPQFESQTNPVRIVVKHRNHLSVINGGAALSFTDSPVIYDFTTGLGQAYKMNSFDPTPMKQKNGKWCMWAGDINGDGMVDVVDQGYVEYEVKNVTFDKYLKEDLNMDGIADPLDKGLMDANCSPFKYSAQAYFE